MQRSPSVGFFLYSVPTSFNNDNKSNNIQNSFRNEKYLPLQPVTYSQSFETTFLQDTVITPYKDKSNSTSNTNSTAVFALANSFTQHILTNANQTPNYQHPNNKYSFKIPRNKSPITTTQEVVFDRYLHNTTANINIENIIATYNSLILFEEFGTIDSMNRFKAFFNCFPLNILSIFSYTFSVKCSEKNQKIFEIRSQIFTPKNCIVELKLQNVINLITMPANLEIMYDIVLSLRYQLKLVNIRFGPTINDALHFCAKKIYKEIVLKNIP